MNDSKDIHKNNCFRRNTQNFRPQNNSVIQLMDKKNVKPELKGNFGNTYVFIKSTSKPVSGLTSNRAQLWLLATTL